MTICISKYKPAHLIIALALLYLSIYLNNLVVSLVIFFLYSLCIIWYHSDGTASDPRVLFTGFFYLYSVWFPLQVIIVGEHLLPVEIDLIINTINYSFFGAIVYVSVLNIVIKKHANGEILQFDYKNASLNSEILLSFIIIIVLIFTLINIYTSGASTKREVLETGGVLYKISYFSSLLLVAVFVLNNVRNNISIYNKYNILFILISIVYLSISGQRDLIFRIGIILLIIYYGRKRNFTPYKYLLLILIAAIIVPFSQAFKSFILAGQIDVPQLGFELIFSNEFISAGKNLYAVQYYGVDHSIKPLYKDFVRAVIPSFLYNPFDIESTTMWYNNSYRVANNYSGTAGWGFGIIAQGYLIGKSKGVLLIMAIYSLIIGFIYNNRNKSLYHYVFYMLSIIVSIYCIRADIANFISQIFKINGTMLMVLYIFHRIFVKLK